MTARAPRKLQAPRLYALVFALAVAATAGGVAALWLKSC
jgi:hypothetical protein